MPIKTAAARILDSLEAKMLRRPWNPDLHPRDSKGRFVETGGIARMWGGGLARVLRALGGRDVLVENLATHQRSRINAARLTMVSRPDGSAPTKNMEKVRDEDERRYGDENRRSGFGPHLPEKDDNGEDHGENDHGDNGLTPDTVHEKDDQDQPIGADVEGVDHGAGPHPEDDEPLLVHRGRVMSNSKDDDGNPLDEQEGRTQQPNYPDRQPIGSELASGGKDDHARHVAGAGDALRADGPRDKHADGNPYLRFWDTNHARRAIRDLQDDYFGSLEAVWPRGWDNPEADHLYSELHDVGTGFDVRDDKNDQLDPDDVDRLLQLRDDAHELSDLAHADGREDVAQHAANLRDALELAWDRFQAHDGNPIPAPGKKLAKDQPLVPRAWRSDGRVTQSFTPNPKIANTPTAAAGGGRGGKRFASLDDLKAFWQSGKLEPYTKDKAAQQRHQKETATLFDKLARPQLSRKGTFVVAQITVEGKDGKRRTGYAVIVSGSGVRLAMSDRKGEAVDFANRLEAAQMNGKPFDWDSPGYHERLESEAGQAMVRQAGIEAKKAFADKAAKKRDGAAAKHTPAPVTPAPSAQPQVGKPTADVAEPYHRVAGDQKDYDKVREHWKQLISQAPPSRARDDLEAAANKQFGTVAGDIAFVHNQGSDRGSPTSVELRDIETGRKLPFALFRSDGSAISFLRDSVDREMVNPDGSWKYPEGPERDRKWIELIAAIGNGYEGPSVEMRKSLQARSAQKWLDAHNANQPQGGAPVERPNPLVQAARSIADSTGVTRQNIAVGHVGPSSDGNDGDGFQKPGNTGELREYWKSGGAPGLDAHRQDALRSMANHKGWKLTFANHFGFAILQRDTHRFDVLRAYDGRSLGHTGFAGQGFKTWEDASLFATQVGSQVREPSHPDQAVDWWDPELGRRNRHPVASWNKAFGRQMDDLRGRFDIEHGAPESHNAKEYLKRQEEENKPSAPDAPATPDQPESAAADESAPQPTPQAQPAQRDWSQVPRADLDAAYAKADKDYWATSDSSTDADRAERDRAGAESEAILAAAQRHDEQEYASQLSRVTLGAPNDRGFLPVSVDGRNKDSATLQGSAGRWQWNRLGRSSRYSSKRRFLTREAALADLVHEQDGEARSASETADIDTGPSLAAMAADTQARQHIADSLHQAWQQILPAVNDVREMHGDDTARELGIQAADPIQKLQDGDLEPSEAIQAFQNALDSIQRAIHAQRGSNHTHSQNLLRLARENVSVARQSLPYLRNRSTNGGVRGSRSDVLEDVPAQRGGGDADERGAGGLRPAAVGRDHAADHRSDGRLGSPDGGGAGRRGSRARAEVGADAGSGTGAARHGVRDGEGAGDGAAGHAAGGAASAVAFGTPEQQATAPAFEPPASGETLAPSSPLSRAKANIAAIEILHRLEAENRPATPEEQKELARYSGWGAVPHIFKPRPDAQFAPLAEKLRHLLTDQEWEDAEANTLNAHYTDPQIVQQVWAAVQGLGFDGGAVLEPGSGIGNFIGYAPAGAEMTGVEVDPITARIAKALYPHSEVRHESFGETRAPNGTFDLAVGNVPFGRYKVPDLVHNKGAHSIHNHFILKSLDLTRGGGLVAVVTSSLTMDGHGSKSEAARMEMAEKADLVGAIRLPSGAHQRTAGTGVLTDLLIFKRRDKDKKFSSGRTRKGEVKRASERSQTDPPMWVHSLPRFGLPGQADPNTDSEAQPVFYNSYFHDHPEQVLGQLAVGHGQHRDNELRVDGDGHTITKLDRALKRTVAAANDAGLGYRAAPENRRKVTLLPPGSPRVDGHVQAEADGTFTQVRDGMVHPFAVPRTQADEARRLLAIRDTFQSLLREESRKDADESLIERLRQALNDQYEGYFNKYGAINRFSWSKRTVTDPDTGEQKQKSYRKKEPRGGLFVKDPTMANITPLDEYDDNTGKTTRAAIFTKRQGIYREIAQHADDPQDALAIVLETDGRLTADGLGRVMNTDPDRAVAQLLAARSVDPDTGVEYPLAFQDPDGRLVTAADYLSGNVREKLAAARDAAADDPRFDLHVEHLERVVPADLSTGEIAAPMGAAWIGQEPVQQFLRETLGSQQISVSWQGGALWAVDAPDSVKKAVAYNTRDTWSTPGYDALKIAEAILTNRKIVVTTKTREGTVFDPKGTEDAKTKADLLKEAFTDWLWADPDRAEKYKRLYNDTYNSMAPRSYDGQRRTIPGLVEWFKPHPHQHAAVARMVNEPSVLLAHEVGAGKTAEMAMGVMELRRLGLVKKAAIVVPGHMLEQFRHEFAEIFPESVANNRILTASSDDLAGKGRREFISRAAAGDYDAIILTQTAFESIQMRPEVQESYIGRRVERLEDKIRRQKELDGEDNDTRLVKRMQNSLKALREKLDKKLSGLKDAAGLHFEDMGIDYLVVDEAHMYKNLDTPSSIAAIDGSNRASDLEMKLEYLRERSPSGRVVTFATATPVANSIAEVHTMMRYLRPDLLEQLGLMDFDDFASVFAQMVGGIERSADGSYKEKVRLAAFQNVPELLRLWRSFADVKTAEDLDLPTPAVAGGKAVTITMPMSEAQLEYEEQIKARAARLEGGSVDPSEDNWLKLLGDGRMAALDPRLLDSRLGAGNKLPTVADNIRRIYEETKDAVYPTDKTDPTPHDVPGGLQIVFLDLGTPKDPGRTKKRKKKAGASAEDAEDISGDAEGAGGDGDEAYSDFSTYDELKKLLIARGVPSEKIRFIHEAKDDAAKARLFHDARSGKVSVLLGSTAKMGTGTNVQLRAVALHHVDAPWRPADVDQRNGRVIRQGNANDEVAIFQYATERSTDAKFWEAIARKAKFIRQLMRGSLSERVVEDIGEIRVDADEASALVAGDPHLIAQSQIKPIVQRLRARFNAYHRSQEGFKRAIRDAELSEEETGRAVTVLRAAIAKRSPTRGADFNARIGRTDFAGTEGRQEARNALNTVLRAIIADGRQRAYSPDEPPKVIGHVGGLDVTAKYNRMYSPSGSLVHRVAVEMPSVLGYQRFYDLHDLVDVDGQPQSLPLMRLEDQVAGIEARVRGAENILADRKRAAEQAAGRVGKPFELAEEFDKANHQLEILNEIMRLKAQPMGAEADNKKREAAIKELDAELRATLGEQEDVLAQVSARDLDLVPKTPAPPAITQDDKGNVSWVWPTTAARDAERDKKLAVKREAFLARTARRQQEAPAQADALGMNDAELNSESERLAGLISRDEASEADVVRHAGLERERTFRAKKRAAESPAGTPGEASAKPDTTRTSDAQNTPPSTPAPESEPEQEQAPAEETPASEAAAEGAQTTKPSAVGKREPAAGIPGTGPKAPAPKPAPQQPAARSKAPSRDKNPTVRPFADDREWRRAMAGVEGAQGQVSQAAEAAWGRDGESAVRNLRDRTFEAIAAQEANDFDDAAGALAAAREEARELRDGLSDGDRQHMDEPLANFMRISDDYLARHAVTVEKRRREDVQRDDLERQAREDFRRSMLGDRTPAPAPERAQSNQPEAAPEGEAPAAADDSETAGLFARGKAENRRALDALQERYQQQFGDSARDHVAQLSRELFTFLDQQWGEAASDTFGPASETSLHLAGALHDQEMTPEEREGRFGVQLGSVLRELRARRDRLTQPSGPETTPAADESDSAPRHRQGAPSDVRPAPATPPAAMSDDQLGDTIDDLDRRLDGLKGSTDPVDLAYRHRLEQRRFALDEEERRRWQPTPEYDDEGREIPRKRGDVVRDRLAGYGLNNAEVQGLAHTVDDLPAAKPGGYSDEAWAKIDADASAREAYPPTDEQRVIIEGAARRGLNMAVMALAGTGKSSTLKMLSHRMPGKKIVYLAFNRSVAAEAREAQARGEYAKNLLASTANSYAAKVADKRLNNRLPSNKARGFKKLSAQQIADRMRWYDTVKVGNRDLSPGGAATVAERMIREWAKSADPEMGPQHITGAQTNREARDLFKAVKPLADRMWTNLTDPAHGNPDEDLTMDFDYIVKMWALGGYKLDADTLMWDEAQDVNPVMEGVVRGALDQGVQVIAVGDSNQAIYGFRGASDALGKLPVDARATLTQSFRFGPAVANVGNRFLRLLGTRMRLKGFDRKRSRLETIKPGDETMVIARTNAGVALAAVQALAAGRTIAVSGGVKDLQEFVQAARALAAGENTNHAELARFNGMPYEDILEAVKADPDLTQLDTLFQLLDKHSDEVDQLLGSGARAAHSENVGGRVWVTLDWNDPKADQLKRWLGDAKNNGVGKLLYDPATRRYSYEPGKRNVPWKNERSGRSGVHRIDNRLSLEDAQQKIDAYLEKLYPKGDTEGGRLVDEKLPHDVLVTTAHKSKGLESERVRIADDFRGPEYDDNGHIKWDTMPDDEALRTAYVAVTRATDVLDSGSLGWVFEAVGDDDPTQPPTGEYRRNWVVDDFHAGDRVDFQSEDGTPFSGEVARLDAPGLVVRYDDDGRQREEYIITAQVQRLNGQRRPLLPVASDDELNRAISEGRHEPVSTPEPDETNIPQPADTTVAEPAPAPEIDPRRAHYDEPGLQSTREAHEERMDLISAWEASPLRAGLLGQEEGSEGRRLAEDFGEALANRDTNDQMYSIQTRGWKRVIRTADALLAYLGEHPEDDRASGRAALEQLRDKADIHIGRMKTTTEEGSTSALYARIRAYEERQAAQSSATETPTVVSAPGTPEARPAPERRGTPVEPVAAQGRDELAKPKDEQTSPPPADDDVPASATGTDSEQDQDAPQSGWKGPDETRESAGEYNGKPVEVGEPHIIPGERKFIADQHRRAVYLDGERIGSLLRSQERHSWRADHDAHGAVGADHSWYDDAKHANAVHAAALAVAESHDKPLLSFPSDTSPTGRAAPVRRWAGIWAEPQPAGVRNVFLDQVLAENGGPVWMVGSDPYSVKHWINTVAHAKPLAQYDENLRRSLTEVPPESRQFLGDLATDLRSSLQRMGEELRADIRPVLVDNIATRAGQKKAAERLQEMSDDQGRKVQAAVREQISRARTGAVEHGLSEQQAEDFIVNVVGGDDPDTQAYGVRGRFPEAFRPLAAALADGTAYRSAFRGWITQDDDSQWAGMHWENGRRESLGLPSLPYADPAAGVGEVKIGESELPKGMRWARGSELRKGDIFRAVQPSQSTPGGFDGLESPQYVVHEHADGVDGRLRTVSLSTGGFRSPRPDDYVVLLTSPDPAVRKKAQSKARTDPNLKWDLPRDEESRELGGIDHVRALAARADLDPLPGSKGRENQSVSVDGEEIGQIHRTGINATEAVAPGGQRRTWHDESHAVAALVIAHDSRHSDGSGRTDEPSTGTADRAASPSAPGAGDVSGRRTDTAGESVLPLEELKKYEDESEQQNITPEGEKLLFGSQERMRELASQAEVVNNQASTAFTHHPQVWRHGRLIGKLFAPDLVAFGTPDEPRSWWSEDPIDSSLLVRFRSREAAIANLVLRDMERGEPDLSRVDPRLRQDVGGSVRALGLPEGLEGFEALEGSAEGLARLAEVRELLDALANGVTPSGNVADDLAKVHDELQWLARFYKQPPIELGSGKHHILGPTWLTRQIGEYLDALRPSDARAANHLDRRTSAEKQFLRDFLAGGAEQRAVPISVNDIREGDIVSLSGRMTRYTGATGQETGYVVGAPTKATLTINKKRQKAVRIRVAKELHADPRFEREYEAFIMPVDSRGKLLARAGDYTIPVDDRSYGMPDDNDQVNGPQNTSTASAGSAPSGTTQAGRAADDRSAEQSAPAPKQRPAGEAPASRAAGAAAGDRSSASQPPARTADGPMGTSTGGSRPASPAPVPQPEPAEKPTTPKEGTPERPAVPEPVGGRPAEWVQMADIGMGDLVRVDGVTRQGKARTSAGYVIDGPREIDAVRSRKVQGMYRTVIAETPDGKGDRETVWTPQDATAARATLDSGDSAPVGTPTGAGSDVLTGSLSDRVPTDSRGNGLFPGTIVTDANGRQGVVKGANASTVQVRFGNDRTDDAAAPSSLMVADGGAARPSGWTPNGHRVTVGSVVGDSDGSMLGTVEEIDGDTATVATPDGMTPMPVIGLRVIGTTQDQQAGQPPKVARVETPSDVNPGDVILVGAGRDRAVRVMGFGDHPETGRPSIQAQDVATGETEWLPRNAGTPYTRLVAEDGSAPDLGRDDVPQQTDPITPVDEPAPDITPVTGESVDPGLSPEERDAVTDRGVAPADDPEAQQAAARIGEGLPVAPAQAAALAEELREGADTSTPEGRAAKRAADRLDQVAGRQQGDTEPPEPEPGTIGSVGVGDTIALPDETSPDTLASYRVVDVEDVPGGVRVLTVEDQDGQRSQHTRAATDPLYQLPDPEPSPGSTDDEPGDPNPGFNAAEFTSGYADSVARTVVDSAVGGTATPGSIHQLREQIAQQVTPEAMRTALRKLRQGATAAVDAAGVTGDERAQLLADMRRAALKARMDAVQAAVRTLDDLEPLDGESPEDTARRAADLLRLIPEALRNRGDGDVDGGTGAAGTAVADQVGSHVDDVVGDALQTAAHGVLTPQRQTDILSRMAQQFADDRPEVADQIASLAPEGERAGIVAQAVAALMVIARRVIELVAAFLRALARGVRSIGRTLGRFRTSLARRIRSWPETRRLRRLAAAARSLPQPGDGLSLTEKIAHWAHLLPAPGRFGQVARRVRWYRPTRRAVLTAGQLPAVQDGMRWTMDRAADRGPGKQALRHLAALRAAGVDIDTDVVARLTAAAPELGDDPHGSVRHARRYQERTQARARDLRVVASGINAPDLGPEIAAADVEARHARQEADRLTQAYTAALPGAIRNSLAEVREMGPSGRNRLALDDSSDDAAAQALADASQYVPADWLTGLAARPVMAVDGSEGEYDADSATATVADLGDGGLGTAAHALFMHLQQSAPDLLAAQEAFAFARTHTGRPGARRSAIDALMARLFGGREDQVSKRERELAARALATMFTGDWYRDDDLRAFLLGLLATR
ncbi:MULTISPECIES: UvrD-helicase domain-containing protein [unclassified Streptomyces]|uniref:UvrD-helicase domain-containing protein n=1 Tax=unclassified Streptomyces TaxID=2593676 RepID=UPI00331E6225